MNNQLFTRKISTQTKWLFVFVILPLYLFFGSIIGSALLKFVLVTFSIQMDYYSINCYLNVVVDLGLLIVVFLVFKDQMIKQWKEFKNDLQGNLLYGFVVGPVFIYAVGILGGLITIILGGANTSENQALIESITQVQPFLMMMTTIVFAPVLEEMIFRGIVFGWTYERNPKIAHIVSAFVFGFVHVMNAVLSGQISEWIQIFSYFFMGLALSYLYAKKNNIYVPILSHAMNNLISMIFILL